MEFEKVTTDAAVQFCIEKGWPPEKFALAMSILEACAKPLPERPSPKERRKRIEARRRARECFTDRAAGEQAIRDAQSGNWDVLAAAVLGWTMGGGDAHGLEIWAAWQLFNQPDSAPHG